MRMLNLTCKNHPDLRWMIKSIAWTPGRGYNGQRNIHFMGKEDYTPCPECKCPAKDLILAPGETEDNLG